MAVYFIRSGDDGPVKIGSTNNIRRRMQMLQTGSAYKLVLLRAFTGGEAEEKIIHARLSRFRISGEWFEASDEVLNGETGLSPLDDPKKLSLKPSCRRNIWSPEAKKRFAEKSATRWSNPEWADAERKRRKEGGPRLSRLYHERQASYFMDASQRCRNARDEKGASWCVDQADSHFQILQEKFGIPREELRPDLFRRKEAQGRVVHMDKTSTRQPTCIPAGQYRRTGF